MAVTRAIGEVIPEGESTGEPLWEYVAYVTLEDGSVTQTILTIPDPLLAGEFKVIKGRLDTQGIVQPDEESIGVSFNLKWDEGFGFDTDL